MSISLHHPRDDPEDSELLHKHCSCHTRLSRLNTCKLNSMRNNTFQHKVPNCWSTFYIHVTVHRNKFLFNNQPDASNIQIYSVKKLHMFRATSLPIIRTFLLYIRHWLSFMQVFDDRFQAESGWNCNSILTVLGNGHQTCMKLTSAECTVENS